MNYRYSQGADPRWTASGPTQSVNTSTEATQLSKGLIAVLPTATSRGACQGIANWWLIKRALGQDFWEWFGPPTCAAPASTRKHGAAGEPVLVIKEIMNAQNTLFKIPGMTRAGNQSGAVNYVLAKTQGHLVTKRGMVVRENQTWKSFAYEIAVAKGYVTIGFSRTGWGGHAIAAHVCNDGSVEFFDPNYGEFEFDSTPAFFAWMEQQLGRCYGFDRITTFELQTLARPGQ